MEYIEGIIWYSLWPFVILVAVRFIILNAEHFKKMERLEYLEELVAKHNLD